MKLHVKNIGIVREANIEIDKISILTGVNGYGKSTIGKVFYSIASSLRLLNEETLKFSKYESIYRELYRFKNLFLEDEIDSFEENLNEYRVLLRNYSYLLTDYLADDHEFSQFHEHYEELISKIIKENLRPIDHNIETQEGNTFAALKRIKDRIDLDSNDDSIKSKIVLDKLFQEFSNSVMSSHLDSGKANINFIDKKLNKIDISILSNKDIDIDIDFHSKYENSFYIDDPFVLDYRNRIRRPLMRHMPTIIGGRHSDELLTSIMKDSQQDELNYFEVVFLDDSIENIFSSTLNGEIKFKGRDLKYMGDNLNEAIPLENMSSGLKSFSILYLLAKKNLLRDCDLLILDEPETNLHPEWQLKLAKLIVMISKEYPIKILVASHSPYFIEALELYSKNEETWEGMKYYISEMDSFGMTNIEEVNKNDLQEIYMKLYEPLSELEKLRQEINREK